MSEADTKFKKGDRIIIPAPDREIEFEVTQVGHFGSQAHYGGIFETTAPSYMWGNGWIPVAIADLIAKEVL